MFDSRAEISRWIYNIIKIRKYTLLEMLFADDAAVCAHSEEELQEIMQIFYQTFQEFGLQLALKKNRSHGAKILPGRNKT